MLSNYQQVKVSAPPNLSEPIGFDQLPDGRIIQTARTGTRAPARPGRHDGHRRLRRPDLPTTLRVYTNSEDGLYGPAVDSDFATDHWVYLYYAPQTVDERQALGRLDRHADDAEHDAAELGRANRRAWDPYVGYFQLSRFKFVDDAPGVPAHLDLTSEQQILRVDNNRQECCHVAGDIDFDKAQQPVDGHG